MGGYLYFTILNYGGWLASNDRPTPILLCTNEQVNGGWLATPSTPLDQPLTPLELVCIKLLCVPYLGYHYWFIHHVNAIQLEILME